MCSRRFSAGEMPTANPPCSRADLEIRSGRPVVAPEIRIQSCLAMAAPSFSASCFRRAFSAFVSASLSEAPITPMTRFVMNHLEKSYHEAHEAAKGKSIDHLRRDESE